MAETRMRRVVWRILVAVPVAWVLANLVHDLLAVIANG